MIATDGVIAWRFRAVRCSTDPPDVASGGALGAALGDAADVALGDTPVGAIEVPSADVAAAPPDEVSDEG